MKAPIKITVIYLIMGFTWILVSDEVLLFFFKESDLNRISYFQTLKGVFYVVITGMVLYLLIYKYHKTITHKINELKNVNKKLQTSNSELEQFAYVASHDLQEPLRMITSFLTQLEKKYNNQLDDKAKQYINFALEGSARMRNIILDLLEFSRVGTHEEEKELLDTNEIVEETKMLLRKLIEEKNATITYKELPTILAYRSPMVQVFQNLISNSLKYAKTDEAPIIEISAKDLKHEWQFTIKDNGIGISKAYYDKIFVIFQRLHNQKEYSGTGMGLAIVKKIVESFGGKIWLESEEGKGSTFYFTLPK